MIPDPSSSVPTTSPLVAVQTHPGSKSPDPAPVSVPMLHRPEETPKPSTDPEEQLPEPSTGVPVLQTNAGGDHPQLADPAPNTAPESLPQDKNPSQNADPGTPIQPQQSDYANLDDPSAPPNAIPSVSDMPNQNVNDVPPVEPLDQSSGLFLQPQVSLWLPQPGPPALNPIFTIDGKAITPLTSGVAIGEVTITPGASPITVSGTPIALLPSIIMAGTAMTPLLSMHEVPSVTKFDGKEIKQVSNGISIAGTIIAPGDPPIMISGTPMFVGSALVVGENTIPMPMAISAPSVATIAGLAMQPIRNGLSIAGTIMTPGAAAITASGMSISLGSSALVVGTATIPYEVANMPALTTGYDEQAAAASAIAAAFADITPSPGVSSALINHSLIDPPQTSSIGWAAMIMNALQRAESSTSNITASAPIVTSVPSEDGGTNVGGGKGVGGDAYTSTYPGSADAAATHHAPKSGGSQSKEDVWLGVRVLFLGCTIVMNIFV